MISALRDLAYQNSSRPATKGIIVVFTFFERMSECCRSAEFLASKGFHRDCAALIASLMEMRTDLQYMAKEPDRATKWLQHADDKNVPWGMGTKLKSIFAGQQNELEAQRKVYTMFCSVKHANPNAKSAAFELPLENGDLMGPREKLAERIIPAYLFAIGMELKEAAVAGARLVHSGGFDIQNRLNEMQVAMNVLQDAHLDHVTAMAIDMAS